MEVLYTPLQAVEPQVRLLKMESAQEYEPVRCSMEVVCLSEAPRFTALSYVWGDENPQEEILLNGHKKLVRVNLVNALRHVQAHWCKAFSNEESKDFRLWGDAICINQDDILEKNYQVALMSSIYSRAELVISWLGDSSATICLGLDTIQLVAEQTLNMTIEDVCSLQWMKRHPSLHVGQAEFNSPFPYNARWYSLFTLFVLPS